MPDAARRWQVLEHAVATTGLWQALLRDGVPPAWEGVPTTSRALIQERLEESLADPGLAGDAAAAAEIRGGHQAFLSAGRAGDLCAFVYDREAWETYLLGVLARLELAEAGLSTARIALVGTSDPVHTQARVARAFAPGQASVVGLQDGIARCAERLQRFDTHVLYGFSSALVMLAARQLAGRLRIAPRHVFAGTDALTASGRRLIREAWGCDAFDCYASTEGGMMAVECAAHDALHLDERRVLLELHPDGVLLTNLVNRAQPFIRYRVADAVEDAAGQCPCGRPGRRVRLLEGRAVEPWSLPGTAGEEEPVHPIVLRSALDRLRGAAGARVAWSGDVLEVRLAGTADAQEARDRALAALRRAAVDVGRLEVEVTAL